MKVIIFDNINYMNNIKTIIIASALTLLVGAIVIFKIKSNKLKTLTAKLMKVQGDLVLQKTKVILDKDKKEIEVLDDKVAKAVKTYHNLLKSYLNRK